MKKWLFLALLGAVILPAKGQLQETSPEESKILALENAWNTAEEQKDVRALANRPTTCWCTWTGTVQG